MKNIIVLIILLFSVLASSQKVEIVGGVTYSMFTDIDIGIGFGAEYSHETGYAFRVAFENAKTHKFKWRFAIGFEKYGGKIKASSGLGLFGTDTKVEADIDKSVFTFTFYPINLSLRNRFDFNLGLEGSKLIYDNYEGIVVTYTNNQILNSTPPPLSLKT